MAQALYNQHPLDEYLKESGDKREQLPGTFMDSDEEAENASAWEGYADSVIMSSSLQVLEQWSSALRNLFTSPSDDIAERFKYDLISSNLLSSSVTLSPISIHSRLRSSTPDHHLPGELELPQQEATSKSDADLKSLSSAFVIFGLFALISRHRMTALLALLMSFSFAKAPGVGSARKSYIPQMFEALDNLKLAGSAWDAAINDAVELIEREERRSPYASSSTAPSPISALRITLHSSLLTTQQQCDNVRPLLAALACPMELSQLSEMYAPPSPAKPAFTLQTRPSSPQHKPASLSENYISGPSQSPTSSSEKRQTWNGTYMNPVKSNSRISPAFSRKKDRRRSDLSIFSSAQTVPPFVKSITSPRSPSLMQVLEEEGVEQFRLREEPSGSSIRENSPHEEVFGPAALSLRRRRRVSGAGVLGLSGARSTPSLRDSVNLARSPGSSGRLTSLSSSRHPLSLNAIDHALQGALASRRYACAHLLALRFTEDPEDEAYWENVRSVIGLLTSVLEDTAARLGEALAAVDDLRRQDGLPTPESSEASPVKTPNDQLPASTSFGLQGNRLKPLPHESKPSALLDLQNPPSPEDVHSFAPTPNGISRFASHVDAISSSLSDAKGHLLDCVQGLRDARAAAVLQPSTAEHDSVDPSEESILESYERLRKELGYALRECERGKAALLDVFEAQRMRNRAQDENEEVDDASETSSSHTRFHMLSGSSKDSNDKTDPDPLTPGDGSPIMPNLPPLEDASGNEYVDDATQHLLLSASSTHLPPPGLEQIFESDSITTGPFNRERSKLPREERIKLMRAKRESMSNRGLAAHLEEEEDGEMRPERYKGWGPGTEVVEELKDVIWKVGERRRRMTEKTSTPAAPHIPVGTANVSSDGIADYDANLCTA